MLGSCQDVLAGVTLKVKLRNQWDSGEKYTHEVDCFHFETQSNLIQKFKLMVMIIRWLSERINTVQFLKRE